MQLKDTIGIIAMVSFIIGWTDGYRYTLFPFEILTPCIPDNTCGVNNITHTSCSMEPSKECVGFKELSFPRVSKVQVLMGINGIRNRIAETWQIANMNLLHWDRYLGFMATRYVTKCCLNPDDCDFILNSSFSVGQTLAYTDVPAKAGEWHVVPIRSWYTEIVKDKQPAINSVEELKRINLRYPNFTQLIWPTAEFVGCAAARMFEGYQMTCYFHPRFNISQFDHSFVKGRACSKCSTDRPTCLRTFIHLCGLDIPLRTTDNKGSNLIPSIILLVFDLLVLIVSKFLSQ